MKKFAILLVVVLCVMGLSACVNTGVIKEIESIEFETKEVTLNVGETFTTKVIAKLTEAALTKLDYVVANDTIASIENGVITAKACGETTITAKVSSSITAEMKVKVIKPIESIAFATKTATLNFGEKFTTNLVITPSDATASTVNYVVSNNAIASIANGVITAKACGKTTITAKASSTVTDSIEVIVNTPSDYTVYTSSAYNLIYPTTYTPSSQTTSGIVVNSFVAPNSNNFNITSEPKNRIYDTITATQFEQALLPQFKALDRNAQVTIDSFERIKICGKDAIHIETSITLFGSSLKQTSYIVRGESKEYAIHFTGDSKEFNLVKETVMNNFYLK